MEEYVLKEKSVDQTEASLIPWRDLAYSWECLHCLSSMLYVNLIFHHDATTVLASIKADWAC